jgi:hypothetical protein
MPIKTITKKDALAEKPEPLTVVLAIFIIGRLKGLIKFAGIIIPNKKHRQPLCVSGNRITIK